MARATQAKQDLRPIVHHEAMKLIGQRFAAEVPGLTDRTVAVLAATMPEVTDVLDRGLLRGAIALTNGRMVDRLRGAADERPEGRHVELGRVAAQAGISLEVLDAAYRVGARLAWDVVRQLAAELELPAGAALELAELHVAYVDQLFAESLVGYKTAEQAAGLALAREHQTLLEAILGGGELAETATAARWTLPDRVVAGVLLAASDLPSDALVGRADGATVALLPGETVIDGATPLALGSVVPLTEAATSLRQARRIAALAAAGQLPAAGLLRWEDHLAALVLHADPAAAEALTDRRLAPLDGLPAARQRMLQETLTAWIDHPGQPQAMARALHLHPQTVRYRIARLRERFNDDLDDPEARFEISLALRIRAGPA